jgi:alpha-L-arabinofuranosidase
VNQHWADHQGGLTWELGNELWGNYQVGYPAPNTAGALTLSNSKAVHAVDPKAHLIATGGDGGLFHDWNAQQLADPAGSFEYLSSHFIVNDGVQLANASNDFRVMAMLALPWGLSERIDAIRQQALIANRPDLRLAFTEWLMISNSRTVPNYDNLGGAIFAGGFLNTLMRKSDVVSIADMTGILEFGGIWKKRGQVYTAPAYWVLRSYANAKPHTLLEVVSTSPTYDISHGVTQLPEIKGTPYLDVVAARSEDGRKLILLCVNRYLTRPARTLADLSAFSLAGEAARVTTITGSSVLDGNDKYNPDHVIAVTSFENFTKKTIHTFPPASVTLIEIPVANEHP